MPSIITQLSVSGAPRGTTMGRRVTAPGTRAGGRTAVLWAGARRLGDSEAALGRIRGMPAARRLLNPFMKPAVAGGDTRMLADSYGRVATDLRVSLTDRCNLRCTYCMPAEGLDWLPGPSLLTDDEVVRLVGIGVERLGITEVRYTGGEPLLRRGLVP